MEIHKEDLLRALNKKFVRLSACQRDELGFHWLLPEISVQNSVLIETLLATPERHTLCGGLLFIEPA